MNKSLVTLAAAFTLTASSFTFAESNILSALTQQGVKAEILTDNILSETRGAAMQVLQNTAPSQLTGNKKYYLTYSGFGNDQDYQSYDLVSTSYSHGPWAVNIFGNTYQAVGDDWYADAISNPGSFNLANSQHVDYHYQIFHPGTNILSATSVRDTLWNRNFSITRGNLL